MPTTATFSSSISNTSINNGVLSYNGSKIFIQKLIPTAVGLVLYHRTDIDRSNFKERDCDGLRFTTFKRVIRNKVLKEICWWCKGALDAFKKEYLKEFYLIFIDMNDSFNILESHKFQFEYGNRKMLPRHVTRESLKTAVGDLFRSISEINVEPLKEAQFIPYICLTYNDKVPLDYEPPYFKRDTGDNDLVNYLSSKCKKYISLGQTNTGFHMINYACHIPGWNPGSASTDIVNDTAMQEMDTIKQIESFKRKTVASRGSYQELEENVIYSSTPVPTYSVSTSMDIFDNQDPIKETSNELRHDSIETDDVCVINDTKSQGKIYYDQMNCGCLLKKKCFNINVVECSRCQCLQHLPCLGYLFLPDIVKNNAYVCNECNNVKFNARQHVLCCFRLLLAHTFFNQSFAYEVFNELEHDVKIILVEILEMHNAVQFVNDKYVATDKIEALTEKVFHENGKITSLKELGIKV